MVRKGAALFEPPLAPTHPLWRGSDARLFEAAQALHADLPWLKDHFPVADSLPFYFWVVNSGLRDFPERVGRFLPEIPDAARQKAISNSENLEAFLNGGTASAEGLIRLIETAGFDPFAPRRILDFGCGCARVLRHLIPLAKNSELWGSDIDVEAIAYCQQSMGAARFFANRTTPPLPVADASYDLVFSISVFTHLGSQLRASWLGELRRVIAPGGLAAISIHGDAAWNQVVADRAFQRSIAVRPEDVEAVAGDWGATGVVFVPHITPSAHDHEEPYGLVFFRSDIVPTLFPGFELLRHEPGALAGWQDLVLLRRTPG